MMHLKFPSIEQFDGVFARETYTDDRRSVAYRAKIKLHGTCASVIIDPEGNVSAQSRRKPLTLEADNDGFAAWLEGDKRLWARAKGDDLITVYGEWAGPGIAKGDAIQRTDKPRFFIFAIGVGTAPDFNDKTRLTSKWMITDPDAIRTYLPEGIEGDEVRVLPYEDEEPIVFDFSDERQISQALKILNDSVEALDEQDPYVSRTFGIKHPGEGFVLVPQSSAPGELSLEDYARRSFKTKTAKHRVRKQKQAASPREPLPQTALDFLETFCTEARLEQAAQEICPGRPNIKMLGQIIAWMLKDIQKEAKAEIEALPVEFAKLKPMISGATRDWYQAQIRATYPTAAE
jgi:hypothetical protein